MLLIGTVQKRILLHFQDNMFKIRLSFWCKSERLDQYAVRRAEIWTYHNVTSLSVLSLLQNVETGYDDHPTSLFSGNHGLFPQG